jgi:sortase A
MLAYCAFVLVDTWMFQRRGAREFNTLLLHRVGRSTSPVSTPAPNVSGVIGRLDIPRLGMSVMFVEGTNSTVLRQAAGHISGTALPGQPGNVGISGHRDTFFRPLRGIRRNDLITLATVFGQYRYRVVSIKVVRPDDVAVLDPTEKESLTLVTCYPFYFVGSAPDRFIVTAERVGNAS